MKIIDKFKKALEARVDYMLECAYRVAVDGGYQKSKDEFLLAVRDELAQKPEEKEE